MVEDSLTGRICLACAAGPGCFITAGMMVNIKVLSVGYLDVG